MFNDFFLDHYMPFVVMGKQHVNKLLVHLRALCKHLVGSVPCCLRGTSAVSWSHPSYWIHATSEDELAEAQREDEAVGEIIRLKDTDTELTSDRHHTVNRAVKKLLYECRIYC